MSNRVGDLEKVETRIIFIERNAAPVTNTETTTETVKQTFVRAKTTVLSSGSKTALDSLESHTQSPATPSSPDSLIPLLPIPPPAESSEFQCSSLTPTLSVSSNRPRLSVLQRLGLVSTQSVRSIHESSADRQDAEDRVLGSAFCDETKGSYGHGRVVREIILPDDAKFTLYDLAILVDVVHQVAPIYSLFENHCYWFAKIICDAIVEILNGKCADNDQDSDINNQPYQPPPDRPFSSSHLPSLCGTWKGILVSDVKDDVLVTVLCHFMNRREEERAGVCFPKLYYCLLNFLKVERRQKMRDEQLHREMEVEELRHEAVERDEELQSLRSDMSAVQSEMVALRCKLSMLEGGDVKPSYESTMVRTRIGTI
jgi:hypothetical protein